jgi:hypothetical protein
MSGIRVWNAAIESGLIDESVEGKGLRYDALLIKDHGVAGHPSEGRVKAGDQVALHVEEFVHKSLVLLHGFARHDVAVLWVLDEREGGEDILR